MLRKKDGSPTLKEINLDTDKVVELTIRNAVILQELTRERVSSQSIADIKSKLITHLQNKSVKVVGISVIYGANDLSFFNLKGAANLISIIGVTDTDLGSNVSNDVYKDISDFKLSDDKFMVEANFPIPGGNEQIVGIFGHQSTPPILGVLDMAMYHFKSNDPSFKPTDISLVATTRSNTYLMEVTVLNGKRT